MNPARNRFLLLTGTIAILALFYLAVSMTGRSIEEISILDSNNCTGVAGESCVCSNCTDCIDAINRGGEGATIMLNSNINSTETCLDIPAGNLSNKTFDCADFVIEGNSTGIGISIVGVEDATIKRCAVKNFTIGISVNDSQDNSFTANSAYLNSESGIFLTNSSYNTLDNNFAYNNSLYGIYISYSDGNTIAENTVSNNGDGIDVTGNSNNLSGNTVYSNTNGIYLYYAYETSSYDDEVYDNSNGFTVDSCENTTIREIEAYRNDYGIYIQSSYNTTILDGLFRDSDGSWGVFSTSSSYDKLEKNEFRNNTYGFYSNSQTSQISNNTFEECSYAIVSFADEGNLYENNILRNNNESGFYMQRTNSGTIKSNTITGSRYAINLLESSSSTCTGLVQACNSFITQASCDAQQGCSWNPITRTCSGRATNCALLIRVSCTSQAGCSWVTSYYHDELINISDNILSTGFVGIYIDGHWSAPREAVTKGGYHILLDNEISGFDIGMHINDANHNEINETTFSGSAQEDLLAYDYGSSLDNKIRDASFDGVITDMDYAGQFNISGSSMQGDAPSGYTDIGKFLRITDSSGSGGTVNLTLYYSDSDLDSISDESTLGLWLYSGTDWNEIDYTLDTSANSIKSDLSSFGSFGIFGVEKKGSGGGGGGGAAYGIYEVTEEQLMAGYTRSLAAKGGLKFDLGGELHRIRVIVVSPDEVVLEIASTPQNINFSIGDEKKFDLNGDGSYELSVKLNSVDEEKKTASITIHWIDEKVYSKEAASAEEETASKEYGSLQAKPVLAIILFVILAAVVALIVFLTRSASGRKARKKVRARFR